MTDWLDLGTTEELSQQSLKQISVGRTKLAVSYINGEFGVVSGVARDGKRRT
jgi:hypothetical protein